MRPMSNHRVDSGWPLRWIVLPLLLIFLFASALAVYAFTIRERANSILKDVYALRIGASSTSDIEQLAVRHRGALRERRCDTQKCFIAFEVYNTWLYRVKLEPIARFRVDLEATNGTLNHIGVMLSRETLVFPTFPSAGMIDEYQRVPERWLKFSQAPYWFPTPVGKPYLKVVLTTEASAVQREHAYAFSLRCLIKPGGGCDLPCDYLPLAWRDWQAELENQAFGAGGFGPYYQNRARCK